VEAAPVDAARHDDSGAVPRVGFEWRGVGGIVAVVAVAHGAIATRYGWHRDEFYYVAAGRRLAWGYVDQPPLTPLLARAANAAGRLVGLRVAAIVVQAATIVVAALVAREMGGGRRAQLLTAGCIAGCAVFIGASLFLGTTPVDQLCWTLIIWAALRAMRTATTRAWVLAGIAAGVGLDNKHTVAVLLVALLAGLLVTNPTVLRTRGPWLAAGIAAVVWAPNLWWDATHHWETLHMASALADKQGGIGGSITQLPLLMLLFPGPPIVFMLLRGLRWGRRDGPDRTYRWLLITGAVVVTVFTLAGGKPYYSAPMFVPFFALGSIATERHAFGRPRWPATVPTLIATSAIVGSVLALPYLPASFASAVRPISKEPMETYGWPNLATQVAAVAAANPGVVAVYVSNYGEAGALHTHGRSAGLTLPVVTGHNAYRDWGPPPGTPTDVLAVGEFDQTFLSRAWTDVEQIAVISLPDHLHNEETANHTTIFHCQGPKGTWQQLWPTLSYLA